MYKDISQQWQEENPDLKQMSQQISQIDFGLERLERCLATQFKLLTFMTQTEQHVNKLYKNPEQFPLNRHSAFMTFDPSRVILGPQNEKESIEHYINANSILVEGKRAIVTQGPLSSNFYNFWRMIESNNCNSIFMLCSLIEKGKIKCDRYFPQHGPNNTMNQKEYTVKLIEEEELFKGKIKVKKLELFNAKTAEVRNLTHYQVIDWQDGEIPKKSSQKHVRFLLDQFLGCIAEGSIPIVHCSAGVGRSGTFICMAIIKLQVASNQNISIFNEVRKLREQRWGMVHTLTQYEYLYDFAQDEIERLHNGIPSLSSGSSEEMKEDQEVI